MHSPTQQEEELSPQQPKQRNYYKFSPEEVRVIKECNREAFYQRCLPLAGLLGFSTYYGVKSGFLRGNPRFGAVPKVTVSVICGYFMGKFSYQSKCAEKLMQLPNSQIGEMLRRRRQGTLQESLEPGFGPGMSLGPFSGISQSDTYTDLGPRSSLDMDTSRPQYDGLDDTHRPSLDSNPLYEEEMPPVQKNVTTYDELRKKNRDEYQQKRTAGYRELKSAPQPAGPPPQASSPDGQKNQYGDVWE